MSALIGTVIDARYRVDRVVGEGGFGTVYAAWHLALGTPIALKVLKIGAGLRAEKRNELISGFFDEGRVLTRLKHPNIVSALDLGTVAADGQATPYLAMEWCEGRTLKSLLAERGRLPLAEAYGVVQRVADALGHAHAMGVTHRDLKPGNIMMVDRAGEPIPQVIDFGIAKLMDPAAPEHGAATRGAARRAFTPAYAAPEQVAGGRTGPFTDVHALGLLFITLVTGEKPYGDSEDDNLAVIDTTRPTVERPDIDSGAFGAVIAKAVAARPQDRFRDAHELRDALRKAARETLGETVPPSLRRSHSGPTPEAAHGPEPIVAAPQSDTITEQATAASLRPRRASSELGSPRSWRMVALLATPVAVTALGMALYAGRQTSDAAPTAELASSAEPPTEGSTSASAGPADEIQTFCAMSEEQKKVRLRATGLRGYGWSPSGAHLTSLLDATGAWLSISAIETAGADPSEQLRAATGFLADSTEAIDLLPDRGIAYAMTAGCLVAVRGRTSEATRVLGGLTAGLPIERRGDTFGGGNTIPFTMVASAKWDGHKAKSLAELSEGELLQRVRDAGVEITDAMRAGNALTLSVRKDTARGSIVYYKDPNLLAQLPAILRGASEKEPIYSATDGQVAVVAFGSAGVIDDKVVPRVLIGLGTRTQKTTR